MAQQKDHAGVANERREQLQKDINSMGLIPVDRSIYTKTKEERELLYKLKTAWKVKVAAGYYEQIYVM